MSILDKTYKQNTCSTNIDTLQEEICNILKLKDCYIEGNVLYIRSDKTVTFGGYEMGVLLREDGILNGLIKRIHVDSPVILRVNSDFNFDKNVQFKSDYSVIMDNSTSCHKVIRNINMICTTIFCGNLINILSGKIECGATCFSNDCGFDNVEIKHI